MKTTIITLALILIFGFTEAQLITQSYISKIPALPKDSCNISKMAADNFEQKVVDLTSQIDKEIQKLKAAEKQKSRVNEDQAKAHAMQQMQQQYGLSQEQMSQMKSGKMSAADKQALANQVMQQQTNMSMGEVQNLSKMSESGRQAYGEALGAEMMATSQGGSSQQKEDNDSKTLTQLLTEQQSIMAKINAGSQRIGENYSKIENDPELQKSLSKINSWQSKLTAMGGVDYGQGDKMDSLALLIKNEQVKICDKYTPLYHSALQMHFVYLKTSIPDIYNLGQITAQITKIQTSIDTPPESTEIGCLESIKGYLDKLEGAYKYKLYYPESPQ